MHAVTLRRLLVFGVCAIGVGCLYLVPAGTRAPHSARPLPYDEPTQRSSRRPLQDAAAPTSASATSTAAAGATATSGPTAAMDEPVPATAPPPAAPQSTVTGATAFDPAEQVDDEAPAAVPAVQTRTVTPSRLTLNWPAASDNIAVVRYEVVLDGFQVASTTKTSATIPWFNDDARDHVVQVRAIDAAGNQGPSSPNLLVARPTPEPSATTPSPVESTSTPGPTPTPSPSTSTAVETPEAEKQESPTPTEEN